MRGRDGKSTRGIVVVHSGEHVLETVAELVEKSFDLTKPATKIFHHQASQGGVRVTRVRARVRVR